MTIERTVPAGVRREIDRQESAEAPFVFLTIGHADLADEIRVVSNSFDVVLGGKLYIAFRFQISLLTDADQAPFAQLSIANVDRVIGSVLQSITRPARLKIEIIAGSEFDQSVDPHTELAVAARTYKAENLYLFGVEADAFHIKGRLQTWDYSRETWPGNMATQDAFPGLFR